MDLEAYADALDVALAERRPVAAMLADLDRPAVAGLAAEDCRRLAYHGWSSEVGANPARRSRALKAAAERCPPEAAVERARLVLLAAGDAAEAERTVLAAGAVPSPRLVALVTRLHPLLRQPALARRIADVARFPSDALLLAAKRALPAEVDELRADWLALLLGDARNPAISPGQQLNSVASALQVQKGLAGTPLPASLADEARTLVEDRLTRFPDGFARSGVVNGASLVYAELDDRAAARRLLEQEVRRSKTPHYYLSDLADLAEADGRSAEALTLFEQAYAQTKGPASRFQWGTLYLQALLRLAPRDTRRIEMAGLAVIGELDGPDRLYTRSRVRLEKLDAGLRRWAAANPGAPAVLANLRKRLGPVCARYPAADPVHASCAGFLVEGGTRI
jgi:protein disulfide-isomerase